MNFVVTSWEFIVVSTLRWTILVQSLRITENNLESTFLVCSEAFGAGFQNPHMAAEKVNRI